MSSLSPIDLIAATPTKPPVELFEALTCPVCGRQRGYEGGRPGGREECPDCGAALAATASRATPRELSTSRILL